MMAMLPGLQRSNITKTRKRANHWPNDAACSNMQWFIMHSQQTCSKVHMCRGCAVARVKQALELQA